MSQAVQRTGRHGYRWAWNAGLAMVFAGLVWSSQTFLLRTGAERHRKLAIASDTITSVSYAKGYHVATSRGQRFTLPALTDARMGYRAVYEPRIGQVVSKRAGEYTLPVDGQPALDEGSIQRWMDPFAAKAGLLVAAGGIVVWAGALVHWLTSRPRSGAERARE